MKKLIIAISAIAMTTAANAQEFTTYKPVAGNVVTEFGLTGGLLNTDVKLSEGAMLKGRYFLNDQSALRLSVNITATSDKNNAYDINNNKGIWKENSSFVALGFGYEKHFKGTNRLSPYVGGDFLIGFGGQKEIGENADNSGYRNNFDYKASQSNFAIGLRGVIGADYYFAKNVFLGVEAGLGFTNSVQGKYKATTNGVSVETKSPGSNFNFSPSVITGVRLGFVL